MLTLHLTDGESKLKAIEYQPLNKLKEEDLIPGVKVLKTYISTLVSNLNICYILDRISWSSYVYRSNIVSHRCEFESLRWPSGRAKLD